MKKRVFAIYIMVLCMGLTASAQATEYVDDSEVDVVYLKDGSVFRGTIIKYYPNATLKMRILGDSKVSFKANDIDRIVQRTALEQDLEQDHAPKINPFLEQGFQHNTYFSLLNGTTPWSSDHILGIGLNYSINYRLDSKNSFGLGSGVDYYYLAQREMVIPIFLEVKRSFPWKTSLKPFAMLSGGYSLGLKSENQGVSDSQGGWMVHPALGIEFGSSKDYHWQLDAGVRLQKATFTFDSPWNNLETTTHRMTYKRFALRLGLLF